jgi:predicted SnoaL-like aldol condensation-catalyzing enzyme
MGFLTMFVLGAAASAQPVCEPSAATNRKIVTDFYQLALIDKQPDPAFARSMAPNFIEHKPDVPHGTREATAAFLGGLIKAMPDPKWEVLQVIAEGDLVALHVRFSPAPGAPAYAIGDFFRLKDCKIVEHWDAVAGPPAEAKNPQPRF